MHSASLSMTEEKDHIQAVINTWIVEDNLELREALKLIMEESEEVQCIGDFRSIELLLEHIKKTKPLELPQVVLMDIGLPGKNGIEGTQILKEKYPQISTVILTNTQDTDTIYYALQAGAMGYLIKGVSIEQTLLTIRQTAMGAMVMPAEVARKVGRFFEKVPASEEYGLTKRELEVLEKMCDALKQKEIADALFISTNTVGQHIRSIYEKLQVTTKAGAVAKAIRNRIVK